MTGVVSRDVHVFLADLVVCGLQDVLVLELEVSVDVLAGHEYAVWILRVERCKGRYILLELKLGDVSLLVPQPDYNSHIRCRALHNT